MSRDAVADGLRCAFHFPSWCALRRHGAAHSLRDRIAPHSPDAAPRFPPLIARFAAAALARFTAPDNNPLGTERGQAR
jgi:hypothetical protein